MIDCEKCIYRKNGDCGYENEGCNYIPVGVPVIPISVIKGIKAELEDLERALVKYSRQLLDKYKKEGGEK